MNKSQITETPITTFSIERRGYLLTNLVPRFVEQYPLEKLPDFTRQASTWFVAELEGRILGCAAADIKDETAALSNLWVAPEYLDKGVGEELAEARMDYVRGYGMGLGGALKVLQDDPSWITSAIWIRRNATREDAMCRKHPEMREQLELMKKGGKDLREGLRCLEEKGLAQYWAIYVVHLGPAAKAIARNLVEAEDLSHMRELLEASRSDWKGGPDHWEALHGLQRMNRAHELWAKVLSVLEQSMALERAEAVARAAAQSVPARAALWLEHQLSMAHKRSNTRYSFLSRTP